MEIKPIQTEADYKVALERLDEIFNAEKGTPEAEECEKLTVVIEDFEGDNIKIAMKVQMEKMTEHLKFM
jgi:HTH-type transcriptional regulator / antitoxin HigA